jgi:Tat protein secretion system quality control protein TatD with DNase activity
MIITDTHCHLYSEEFDADIEVVLQRAEAESVKKFYLPCIDSSAIDAMMELARTFSPKMYPDDGAASLLCQGELPGRTGSRSGVVG